MAKAIKSGDRVRMTRKFLQCTGQVTSREASNVWTVTGLCNGDRWAITDEKASEAELAADPTLAFRRIAVGNLQVAK